MTLEKALKETIEIMEEIKYLPKHIKVANASFLQKKDSISNALILDYRVSQEIVNLNDKHEALIQRKIFLEQRLKESKNVIKHYLKISGRPTRYPFVYDCTLFPSHIFTLVNDEVIIMPE